MRIVSCAYRDVRIVKRSLDLRIHGFLFFADTKIVTVADVWTLRRKRGHRRQRRCFATRTLIEATEPVPIFDCRSSAVAVKVMQMGRWTASGIDATCCSAILGFSQHPEVIMAKKSTHPATKSKTKTTATKAKKGKATKKKSPTKKTKPAEIQVDAIEAKAFELAHSSDKVCAELEAAATSAVSQAVRKVFKQHRISLTSVQAEKVALLLFRD
jgi:hypothetical protein